MKPKPPKTLADVRADISLLTIISTDTKRNLLSNLKRFGDIVGVPLELIQAEPDIIRRMMEAAAPAAYGVTNDYFEKIRSGVWKACELVGIKVLRRTGLKLTDELASLLEDVPQLPDRTELTPILKFLIDRKLSPSDLTQAHVPELRDWLKSRYTGRNYSRAMKTSLARWKRCQMNYPQRWPQAPLEFERDTRDWALDWSEMPALEAAIDAHIDELRTPKKRRHGGARRIIKEKYLADRKAYLRRFASAIALSPLNATPTTLEELTDPIAVEAGTEHILAMRGVDVSPDIYQMLRHVNAIARHHVHRSASDMEELKRIRASVAPPKGPADKNRKLLEKFRSEALRELFVSAPGDYLQKLRRKKDLTRKEIAGGMTAFLAALLCKVPMRISEVMALRFGDTIRDHGSGGDRQVIIDLPADQVKNNMPRHAKLGPRLVTLLDVYIKLVRPHLAAAGNPYLFPSMETKARSADHMSNRLAAWTSKYVVRMTAHQWRHVTGYIFLVENPGCYETVRSFLGHRSIATTTQFYAFMIDDDANEALDQTIDDLTDRKGRGPRSPNGKGKR